MFEIIFRMAQANPVLNFNIVTSLSCQVTFSYASSLLTKRWKKMNFVEAH